MESQVSPKNIEDRVEKMAVEEATKTAEVKSEVEKPVEKIEEKPVEKVVEKVSEKPVEKSVEKEKKQPNDPAELRKWATKSSQENAALREELKAVKNAIEKMSKKPVDYAALAKDPEALRKHIDAERSEAASELQQQLTTERNERVKNETIVARMEFERDTENYPRWQKLFPLIQNLAGNQDGRVNFNRPPVEVLHDLYVLAEQLSPSEVAAAPVVPPTPAAAAPIEKGISQAEVDALVAKAKADARAEAAAGLRDEANGAGIGSTGKGGKRDSKVNIDALKKMPLKDLKAMIEKQ